MSSVLMAAWESMSSLARNRVEKIVDTLVERVIDSLVERLIHLRVWSDINLFNPPQPLSTPLNPSQLLSTVLSIPQSLSSMVKISDEDLKSSRTLPSLFLSQREHCPCPPSPATDADAFGVSAAPAEAAPSR